MSLSANAKLLVGTGKGLVECIKDKDKWLVVKVHFPGYPVSALLVDERNHCWWACLAHRHWGQKMHRSFDGGKTWEAVPCPAYPAGALIMPDKPAFLKKIWTLAKGGADRPQTLWMGTEPGGLFVSHDGGDHFELVQSLWDHPSRQREWFGAGRDHPFIHSIVVDPLDSNHVFIAISCAGVFETTDGGQSWVPRNKGLKAAYLPNPNVEIGHDPHLLLSCESQPEVMWQQNHCGIYRSTDSGKHWEEVSGKDGFPYYGFALAIDHNDPLKAWVIPAVSDEMRIAHDMALCVCHTRDGGNSWEAQRKGLPQEFCFDIVFRHSFIRAEKTLIFGTTTGNLFISEDDGESWQALSYHLARIDCLAVAN